MFSRLLLASLAARRARVALALVAVALGVGVAVALATLSLEVGDDLARTLRAAGPNFVVLPAGARLALDLGGAAFQPARAGLALPENAIAVLKSSFWRHNLLEAAPEITVAARIEGHPVSLVGTWFEREVAIEDGHWRTGLSRLRPGWTLVGHWPREDADEIALGETVAARLDLAPGRRVTVSAGDSRVSMLVTAVVAAGGLDDGRAWAPLSRVQALAARKGELDRVWLSALVRAEPRRPAPDPRRDPVGYERYMCTAYPGNLARDLSLRLPGAEVLPMTEVVAGEASVVGRLDLLVLLLALAALTSATLGLLSTTAAAVVERRVELGLLRSLGASSRQLATLLMGETALVSLAGGALGWLLGSLAAGLIRGHAFGPHLALEPLLLPPALVLSLAIAVLGTLAPLRVALRLDPATVLRG